MRPGVTLEEVTQAADRLLFAGERPTVEGVRQLLGTGSPATVNRHLTDYYKGLKDRLTLPPEIAAAAATLHSTIRTSAQAAVDAREAEFLLRVERDREQLAAERAAFDSEKAGLREQVVALTREVERLRDDVAARERQITELQHAWADQSQRAVTAETQAHAAEKERERLLQSHQAELQRLRSQAEGNEKHFLLQIDQLRTENKRLVVEKDKQSSAASTHIRTIEEQLATVNIEVITLNKDVGRLSAELVAEREKLAAELAARTLLIDQNSQEIARLKTQLDQATAESDRQRQTAEARLAERDQALQDAALYRGKVQALQGQLERQAAIEVTATDGESVSRPRSIKKSAAPKQQRAREE